MRTTLGEIRAAAVNMAQADAQTGGKVAPLFGSDGTPGMVYPVTPHRAMYNELLDKYRHAPDDLVILTADLRSEAVLSVAAATQTIVWNVRQDQPNPTNALRTTENRLQTRDSFVAHAMTVMFADELIASITPGTAIYQQWPNPALVAVGGFDANSPGIAEAYIGVVTGTVNSVTFMRQMAALRFQYADFNQRGTLIFTASNAAFNTFAGDRGFVDFTPSLDIKGSDTTQFVLNLPDPFNFGSVALHRVVAACMLRGFLVQGGAQYTL